MKKEISPEMYNYNKFPGPEFVAFDTVVKSDNLTFSLLENEKDAFDATAFSQRFTEILLKYDYIVGDWGNEQLRLKGFYKDSNEVRKSSRISRLEDYIKEFCNFGCAYFVLENPEPVEIKFEEERAPRRRKNTRSSNSKRRSQTGENGKTRSNNKDSLNARPKESQEQRSRSKMKSKDKEGFKARPKGKPKTNPRLKEDDKASQNFTSKKRRSPQKPRPKKENPAASSKAEASNDHFIIRKKDTNS